LLTFCRPAESRARPLLLANEWLFCRARQKLHVNSSRTCNRKRDPLNVGVAAECLCALACLVTDLRRQMAERSTNRAARRKAGRPAVPTVVRATPRHPDSHLTSMG
jgi:hypothetical protein